MATGPINNLPEGWEIVDTPGVSDEPDYRVREGGLIDTARKRRLQAEPPPTPALPEGWSVVEGLQEADLPRDVLPEEPTRTVLGAIPPYGARVEPELATKARAYGISTEPGIRLGKARFAMGFGDPRRGAEAVLGKDAQISFNENLQELTYIDPVTKQETLLNTPGIDWADVATLGADVPGVGIGAMGAIGGAIGGGMAAGPVGAGVGAITGEATGTFTGEMARYIWGKGKGYNNMTEEQMIRQAALVAGVTALASGVGLGLAKIGHRMFIEAPHALTGHISPQIMKQGLKDAAEVQTGMAARGIQMEVSAGQALTHADPELAQSVQALERGLRRDDIAGAGLRELPPQQRQAMEALQEDISDPFAQIQRDPETIGRGIAEEALRGPKRGIAEIGERTGLAREKAKTLGRRLGEAPELDAVAAARDLMGAQRTAQGRVFSAEYESLSAEVGDWIPDLTELRTAGRKHKGLLEADIFQSLSPEDPSVVHDAMFAGLRRTAVEPPSAVQALRKRRGFEELPSKIITEPKPATLGSVARALSDVKAEIRRIEKGTSPKRQKLALEDFRDALQTARDDALKDDPELAARVAEIDRKYRGMKTEIDGEIIGTLLRVKPGGAKVVKDKRVVDEILNDPRAAQRISEIANNPDYAEFNLDLLSSIKEAVRRRYRDKVIDPETGIANIGAHNRFMGDHRDASLRYFFSAKEAADLDKIGMAARVLKTAETKEKNVIARLNRSFGMRLIKANEYDSEKVLAAVMHSPGKARRVKTILKRSPDKWASFQSGTMRNFWDDISSFDPMMKEATPDLVKLDGYLNDRNKRQVLSTIMGEKFIEDVTFLNKALKVTTEIPGVAAELAEYMRPMPSGASVIDMTRAFFAPPLSRRGRAYSAILRANSRATMRVVAEALRNPEQLTKMLKLRHMSPTSKAATVILSDLGAPELPILFSLADEAITQQNKQSGGGK